MRLKQLIRGVPIIELEGSLAREVYGITADPRRISRGMLFASLPTDDATEGESINQAISRGATAVMCERHGLVPSRAAKIKVPDVRAALAMAAAAFYQYPARRLRLIGVAGNQARTVAFLLKQFLEGAGCKSGLISSSRHEIGRRRLPAASLTEALDVQGLLSMMVEACCEACVIEITPELIARKALNQIKFELLLSDSFESLTAPGGIFSDTADTARRWLASKNWETEGKAWRIHPLANEAPETVTIELICAPTAVSRLQAVALQTSREGTWARWLIPGQTFSSHLPFVGRDYLSSTLAAAGAALALNVSPCRIRTMLPQLKPAAGQLESVTLGQPFGIFVDGAQTETDLKNSLETLRTVTPGQLLLVMGSPGGGIPSGRAGLGRIAGGHSDFAIFTSDNPGWEPPGAAAAQMAFGFRSVRREGSFVQLDRRQAIALAVRLAQPGDTVLIAGKGWRSFQEAQGTVSPFDDVAIARQAVEARFVPQTKPAPPRQRVQHALEELACQP